MSDYHQREIETDMNIRAMQNAIADLLAMAGTSYGYPVVQRNSRDLERLHDDLGTLLALLQFDQLKAVS